MTTEIRERLLEAHTDFALAQLSGAPLTNGIALEIEAAFERLARLTLAEVVSQDTVTGFLVTQLHTAPVTPATRAVVLDVVRALRASPQNARLHASDFITKAEFERVVDRLASMDDLRGKLVRSALGSPLYSGLISDVLLNGIRDYLLSDNSMAMKIPGMGSLMKMGKWGLDKTMPNLEGTLEKTLKGYIEANIGRTVGISEKFLDNALNQANIRKLSDHVWTLINEPSVKQVLDVVSERDIDEALQFAEEAWVTLRQNAHLAAWVSEGVAGFYAANGQRPLREWIVSLGLDQARLTADAQRWLPEVVGMPAVQDYLRERIRAALRAFYESEDAARILG